MAIWEAMHAFVDGEPVRAEYLQAIYNNLYAIKNFNFIYNRSVAPGSADNGTTSAAWNVVSSFEMRAFIELSDDVAGGDPYGRDIVVMANVHSYASTSGTVGHIDLAVDGVRVSGTDNGLFVINFFGGQSGTPLIVLVPNLTPGEHELVLMHRRSAGTGTIFTRVDNAYWFYAQEI